MRKKTVVCLSNSVMNCLLTSASKETDLQEDLAFAVKLLLRDFLRKRQLGGDKASRAAKTYELWRKSEKRCFETNQRLNKLTDFDPLACFLLECRRLIESVIGVQPPKWLLSKGRWSSGATFSTRRGTHFSEKMENLTVTPSASLMLQSFAGISHDLTIVRGCRGCLVPKSSTVDRMIAIEPSGNAFLQQSVGSFVRDRLLRIGIDLNDQKPNQYGAFRAVVDELSTIDLESASDSISTSLVRWILPPAWYSLLDELRSPLTLIEGKWIYLDKFSSMGNGYTFELETLIFWSICKACGCDRELLVYGDDIIVPRENASSVMSMLSILGFVPNYEKTFVDGPYFESCGKHYYNLTEVTPVFQKESITDLSSAFRAHNRLTRWSLRTGLWSITRSARKLIREAYPSRCAIPFGAERDDGYLTSPDSLKQDIHGDYKCLVLCTKTVSKAIQHERNAYAYKLYYSGHQNEDPCGRPSNAVRVVITGTRLARVWRSSLTG